MDKIYVFIYRDKADGRINEINIIAEKEIVKNCIALNRNIDNGITEMLLEDIQKHNADSRNKSIVEWTDCQTLLDAENLLRKIRTHEDDKTNIIKQEAARSFVATVGSLAKSYNLPVFVVTDGASLTQNKNCEAVRHARICHIEWEKQHGIEAAHSFLSD